MFAFVSVSLSASVFVGLFEFVSVSLTAFVFVCLIASVTASATVILTAVAIVDLPAELGSSSVKTDISAVGLGNWARIPMVEPSQGRWMVEPS